MHVTTTEHLTTITLSGDLGAKAEALRAGLAEAVRATEGKLLLDLSGCTSLGLAGMGLVMGAFRLRPRGIAFELRARREFASTLRLVFGRRGRPCGFPLTQEEMDAGHSRLGVGLPVLPPAAIVEVE
jgi:anti-anti-sigma regulatory factor